MPRSSRPHTTSRTSALSTRPRRATHRRPPVWHSRHQDTSPSQWGRRVARVVGEKFGVTMAGNRSCNEGELRGRAIAIKCAKSPMPPVTVLIDMLDRVDTLWAVYLTLDDGAEVWAIEMADVKRHGYYTRGPRVQKRVELYRRKAIRIGRLVGTLTPDEVAVCDIP